MQTSDSDLLYVYCIAPSTEVGSVAAVPMSGIDGEVCEIVQYRNLRAIVCRLDSKAYNEQAIEEKMLDSEWVARNATNHHEVVASIYAQSPVLPLPFCTLFSKREQLQQAIDERYEEITETIAFLAEKEVWNLKIYCREQTIREVLLKDQLNAADMRSLSPGKQYIMKKKISQSINVKVEQEQEKVVSPLHEELEGMASSVSIQKRWKESGYEEETMVFNCSYLVPLSNIESFAGKVSTFKEQHMTGNEWKIVMSGPWPPYHFAKVAQGA